MSMTHYMELLASNQPWNLIIFMAIPVILAEALAISELYLLFTRKSSGQVKKINRAAGLVVGWYFLAIALYLFVNAIVPLTLTGGWRGPFDVIAVISYVLGFVPLLGISLLEIGWLKRRENEESKLKLHATFVGVFLVLAHVAMIFGMLNPSLLLAQPAEMPGHMETSAPVI